MIQNWHDSPPPTLPSPALTTKFFRETDLKSVSSSEISPLPSVCSPPATPMFAPSVHGVPPIQDDTPDQSPTMPSPPRSTKIIRFKSTSNDSHHVLVDKTNTTNKVNEYIEREPEERLPENCSVRGSERSTERTSVVMVGNLLGYRHLHSNSSPITPYAIKNRDRIITNTPYRAPNSHDNNTTSTPSVLNMNNNNNNNNNTDSIRPTNDTKTVVPPPSTTLFNISNYDHPTVPTPGTSTSTLDTLMYQGVLDLGFVPPWIPPEFVRPILPGVSYEEKRRSIEELFFEEKPRGNGIPTSISPSFSVDSIKKIFWKMNLSKDEIQNVIEDIYKEGSLETFEMCGRCYWRRKGAFSEWDKNGKWFLE